MDVRDAVTRKMWNYLPRTDRGKIPELTIRTHRTTDDDFESFNNLVIKEEGDKVIRFRDIGIVEVDAEDTRSIMKRNGVPMGGFVPSFLSREPIILILSTGRM